MMARDRRAFLAHALDCLDHVTEFTRTGKESFLLDRKTRDAALRNLEIVGQCIRDFGIESLEATHPNIRWRRIADFRNQLAHAYLGLDLNIIWEIITTHLPALRVAISELLSQTQP